MVLSASSELARVLPGDITSGDVLFSAVLRSTFKSYDNDKLGFLSGCGIISLADEETSLSRERGGLYTARPGLFTAVLYITFPKVITLLM